MTKPGTGTAEALIVWLASYIFYLLNLAGNFSAAHDSINYLYHIVNGTHLFHQHHLLYHFLANSWLTAWKNILPGVPVYYIVESFTALWGSAIVAVCYLVFRNRFMLPGKLALCGCAAIAFSYGLWFYSVNVEVYAPSVFFVVLILYRISRRVPSDSDVVVVALLHSMSILFHQVNVLLTVVIIWWLLKNRSTLKLWRSLAGYMAINFLLTATTYLYAGWFVEGHNDFETFRKWVLGYTVGHHYWQPLDVATPIKAIAGFGRALIGAHFMFQIPVVGSFLQDSFGWHNLEDEMFLTRHLSRSAAWLLAIMSLIIIVALAVLAARFVAGYRQMKIHFHVIHPLLLALLVYSCFFLFWMPEILEFWILQMVIMWLLVLGMLPVIRFPFRISNMAGMLALTVLLMAVNYAGSMKWLKNPANDWYLQEAMKVKPAEGDLVIIHDKWLLKDYLRYYTHARVMAKDDEGFSESAARQMVQQVVARGGKVYLYEGTEKSWRLIQSY